MTIEERANQAAQWKATGIYNCAQAVTQAFADQIPVEAETLKKLGAGYAAGMGCMESTCGVHRILQHLLHKKNRFLPPLRNADNLQCLFVKIFLF